MLVYLSVKDIVLIEKIDIELNNGFTVLTGETGAGKSIIVDAVSLILGKRSEKRLIRKGSEKGTVSALFQIDSNHIAVKHATENGFSIENELILKRQILSNGRSFCYLNDQLITLNLMKEIANLLIEIHGQNEQIGLLDISNHKAILDHWANLNDEVKDLKNIYKKYKEYDKALEKEINLLDQYKKNKNNYIEDLRELDNLDLKTNEIEELNANRKLIMSSEKIKNALNNASYYVKGDGSNKAIYERLNLAKKELESLVDINDNFAKLITAIDQTIIEFNEVELELENSISSLELNNLDRDYIENRLFNLKKIATKHDTEIDKLNDIKNVLKDKLSQLENYEENIKDIEKLRHKYKNLYLEKSKILSKLRGQASKKLSKYVNGELPILKLDNAIFDVKTRLLEEEKWHNSGIDEVFFEVEINKGTGFNSINKVASGGELSRLMLAIKVSLFSDNELLDTKKTIIFDEVDAGVGGSVADAIGKRLDKLGKFNQVLVVTHHPQVAARSRTHLKVNKNTYNNKTNTELSNLNYNDKLEELARMLSGAKITNAARKAAESLLLDNKKIK